MKLIFTLVILLWNVVVNAAGDPADSLPKIKAISTCFNTAFQAPVADKPIGFVCRATLVQTEPLLVLDGFPVELESIKDLNPNDIESITILKDASATTIYGYRAARGVIIFTTKYSSASKFIIKDFLTGDRIPSATVLFTAKSDTIKAVADAQGVLAIDKLKRSVQYKVTVSCAGYKTLSTVANGKDQEVLLERDIKVCEEVLVVAYPPCICRKHSTGTCTRTSIYEIGEGKTTSSRITISSATPARSRLASVYPNPVQRNHAFQLELESEQNEVLLLLVSEANGTIVLVQPQKAVNGFNRFSVTADPRWSAGIYMLQVRNEKGLIIKKEKLIIQ